MSSTKPIPRPPLRRIALWVMILSWLNLAALLIISALLFVVSENWWLGTALVFAPRTPFFWPALALLVASCFFHRDSIGVNLISVGIVVVPIMGLAIPFNRASSADAESKRSQLTIVSCNVQRFKPDFAKILKEIRPIAPNVVAFQEALPLSPLLDDFFRGWNFVHYNSYWVASPFPLKQLAICETASFQRISGLAVEIGTPGGPVVLCDIHQMTARPGLEYLGPKSIVTGEGVPQLERFVSLRDEESIEIRDFVESVRGDKPLIVVGDFNTPATSSLFQKHWGDLQSSFDTAGFGYGYTSPCKGNRFWPDGTPWARIDHILCSSHWKISSCKTGTSNGSDHRLITATMRLSGK